MCDSPTVGRIEAYCSTASGNYAPQSALKQTIELRTTFIASMAVFRRFALLASIVAMFAVALVLNALAVTKLNTDLATHQPIASLILSSHTLLVYEGLPHPVWDGDQLKTQLQSNGHFERHGFRFYSKPIQIAVGDAVRLRSILSDITSFEEHTEEHLCGGFHPDFGVEYRGGNESIFVQVCLGCGEIKFFTSTLQLHADIEDQRHDELRELFKPYQRQWPLEE